AGNIVGGGDWAEDRIVPDCVRSIASGEALRLRNPEAVRPWQHVLDAIHGYLLLGTELLEGRCGAADAWNFGPDPGAPKSVSDLVMHFRREWGGPTPAPVVAASSPGGPAETGQLRLDSSKARRDLGWTTHLEFEEAVRWTADWYRAFYRDRSSMRAATEDQIRRYEARL
ncbi:MAG: CDP-glucose 4,6-dehydratase, partial [Chloroflexi bacterium]|nr:CDP-glucose 4,6-dehydratase [Chloroflexota bacterium]